MSRVTLKPGHYKLDPITDPSWQLCESHLSPATHNLYRKWKTTWRELSKKRPLTPISARTRKTRQRDFSEWRALTGWCTHFLSIHKFGSTIWRNLNCEWEQEMTINMGRNKVGIRGKICVNLVRGLPEYMNENECHFVNHDEPIYLAQTFPTRYTSFYLWGKLNPNWSSHKACQKVEIFTSLGCI